MPLPRRLESVPGSTALVDDAGTRALETTASAALPPHALMSRAGEALARVARALAPHARAAWIAVGPGNNGGDGLVLATLLRRVGIDVRVTRVGHDTSRPLPADAAWALAGAQAAGVPITDALPSEVALAGFDLVVDALLGIGQSRAPAGAMAEAILRVNHAKACVLAVDVPTGLSSDRGAQWGDVAVRAHATLTLLTPKPGLFTGAGRELAGEVWFDALGCEPGAATTDIGIGAIGGVRGVDAPARSKTKLAGFDQAAAVYIARRHLANKGSFGDVHVAGGAAGMVGAALLAARAASAAGAGRVLVHAHAGDAGSALPVDVRHPELMLRPSASLLPALREVGDSTVVAGCGGGPEIARVLPGCLAHAARLVLDADALNVIARDDKLRVALQQRGRRAAPTILTPHPLEAARLLGIGAADVQADRLAAARRLAVDTGAIVVLKGSGTLVASPDGQVSINPTGDARLATAGTGDVLAGWLGGTWAACAKSSSATTSSLSLARQVAIAAVYVHGAACDHTHHARGPLVASELVEAIVRAVEALPA